MTTSRRSTEPTGFAALGLGPDLAAVVTALGYEEPTPVQRETIPLLLAGHDLLALAATGTGKTAAFALPMLQRLAELASATAAPAHEPPNKDAKPRLVGRRRGTVSTGGLVLVPTRELAMQVSEAVHKYAGRHGLTVVPVYGGASMEQQIRALERGASIVVATPGRALDHLRRGTLALDRLRLLVLDEADEMLDMGFADDIEAILDATPATRQTALFSATLPPKIQRIAGQHLRSPKKVQIAQEKTAAGKMPRVRQVAYLVRRDQKPAALDRILDLESPETAIVFCRTRLEVDSLVEALGAHGYRAEALHGGMQQRQRDAVMNRVRTGKTDLLVATDVAARGLDIERITHVVNYDVPSDVESYVHRIGRTGRAGRTGTAITLVDPREHRHLKNIERITRQMIEIASVPTVSDLRRRRLEQTITDLRARITDGGFEEARALVTTLAAEFDIIDVAAAAISLAHAASGEDDEREVDAPALTAPSGERPGRGGRGERDPHDRGADRGGRDARAPRAPGALPEGVTRLFVGAGRNAGVRPGDLVGAIAGETGLTSKKIGPITVTGTYALVGVPTDAVEDVIEALRAVGVRGKRVTVRLDRDR